MSPKIAELILKLASIGVLVFGLLLATGSYSNFDYPAQFILDLLDWPLDGNHAEISRDMRWMVSVVGGLLALIAVMMIAIVAPLIGQGNKQIARFGLIGILAWVVIDCVGSVAAGVASNALWNAAFAVPYLLAFGLMDPKKS